MEHNTLLKILGVILVVGLGVMLGLLYLGSGAAKKSSAIPQSFIAQRNQVAMMLRELSALPDADLSTLTIFEARGDFKGASELINKVAAQNDGIIMHIKKLKGATHALLLDGEKIIDVAMRNSSLDAILELDNGNNAMEKQFALRSKIFTALATYYNNRATNREATAPNLDSDFKLIDEYTNVAKTAYDNFNQKISSFDHSAGFRYNLREDSSNMVAIA